MKKILLFILLSASAWAQPFQKSEISRWKQQASRISIIRDQWGVPHVYGKTDADAAFGLLYVQCEDDFDRVEMNYINALGRSAEVEGESRLYNDLRARLFNDTIEAIKVYKSAPDNMKKLMDAFADGVNFFLYTHPRVKPKLLTRFKSWYPLLFSEGSIGGDIESISMARLKAFYGEGKSVSQIEQEDMNGKPDPEPEPGGSNGFAIAPSRSASGNALFMINPHTSFYFRSEVQAVSEEGLHAYGAVTWGQFFIYQGFNEHCGWMHTSSAADVMDEYLESIIKTKDSVYYQYGGQRKLMKQKKIRIAFKTNNTISNKEFTAYFSHHGPIIAMQNDQWVSMRLMQEPLKALTQSFYRTKSKSLEDFKKNLELKTNSSNNTVFADDKGNIAYWHGNFMPRRNTSFDWNKPVDGSNPETEWKGLHEVNELVQVLNPSTGWIQNCNSTPFTVSGASSPKSERYPAYMAPDPQNARGLNAERVLQRESSFTIDKLITAAYDPYLTGFEILIPSLLKAYDEHVTKHDSIRWKIGEAMELIRPWDYRAEASSVPTALAIMWGQTLRAQVMNRLVPGTDQLSIIQFMSSQTTSEEKLKAFQQTLQELTRDFGTWKVTWGDINRFQRMTGKINETFSDEKFSLPVGFASSFWGSLASFGSKTYPGTKKMYGYVGNSFVAAVEFGKRVKAKSIVTGGSSSDPSSKHFNDQSLMYTNGQFKDVLFYKEDVLKHAEKVYKPGEF